MTIFLNHVGYEPSDAKRFLIEPGAHVPTGSFSVVSVGGNPILSGTLRPEGAVAQWRDWSFWSGDFTGVTTPGRYRVVVEVADGLPVCSETFEVSEGLYRRELLTDLVHYFKSQRCSHIWDQADRSAVLWGTTERYDVHGGWYDASGDTSKYLSHLSYANFMNPQQTPLVVWSLQEALRQSPQATQFLKARLLDEAQYGADFLVRMQHPSGAFFMTLFDKWSKDPEQRELCEYATRNGTKSATWQAAYRQGGGLAVAALARASTLPSGGEYSTQRYLEVALKGFDALEAHGPEWCNDGRENLLDDVCALLAATELWAAARHPAARDAAVLRAQALINRVTPEGWWRMDDEGERSFHHASDEGLPVVALLRFEQVLPGAVAVLPALERALRYTVTLARSVNNPFGYPRHFVKKPGQGERTLFFYPHENESGYWWQGENARLGSLATACTQAAQALPVLAPDLRDLADSCFHWILGRNPFDIGMMHGKGHNNPQYEPGYYPAPGGVCNGITSGRENEEDIAFHTTEEVGPWDSWRWGEQWLPHGAWLLQAVVARSLGAVAPGAR